jgi:ubiquinone/menaquinone biosynthesis C-methylase UbiE
MNWKKYFDNLAKKEKESYKQVGWTSRKSMMAKFNTALKIVEINEEDYVLDIGCGNGMFEKVFMAKYSKPIYAIDISDEELKLAKKRCPECWYEKLSITDIAYPDETFNVIFCIGVLQNFNGSVDKTLKEIYRVLRKDGEIFIITLDSKCKVPDNKLNLRTYVPEDLMKKMENIGFERISYGAIDTRKSKGKIIPLHTWQTFFIYGEKG